jgi:predicted small metal-binding protein
MKLFRCGDVVPGCDAEFNKPTEDELLNAIAVHAYTAHGLGELPPELLTRVRAAIVPA